MFFFKKRLTKSSIILYCAILLISFIVFVFFILKQKGAKTYVFDEKDFQISNDGEVCITSPVFSIPRGNYLLNIDYTASDDSSLFVSIDNDEFVSNNLPAGENCSVATGFYLDHATDKAYFTITTQNGFIIHNIGLISDRYLHTDYYFYALLSVVSAFVIIALFIIYPPGKYKKHWLFFVLTFLLINIPMFINKNVSFLVDTRAHLLRLEGVFRGLQEGQMHVLVYPNLNNQYGQTAALYPASFLYIPAVFRMFDVSIMAIYRVYCYFINLFTLIITFFCAKKIFKDDNKAFITSFIYLFDFCRIDSLYRGGMMLGAVTAMAFYPLVVLGIYSIFYDKRKEWWALPLGMSCIFASHILSFVLIIVLCAGFALLNVKRLSDKEILASLAKSVLISILLSLGNIYAFLKFWFMGVETEQLANAFIWEIKLTGLKLILSLSEVSDSLLFMCYFLIAMAIICICFNTIKKWKSKIQVKFFLDCIIITVVGTFLVTKLFPWEPLMQISLFKNVTDFIQFPQRLYYIVQGPFAFACGCVCTEFISKNKFRIMVTAIIIICISHFAYKTYTGNSPMSDEILIKDHIIGNYNSWENYDYLLKDTNPEWFKTSVGTVSDENSVTSYGYSKRMGHVVYSYSAADDGEFAEFPLIYYEGYRAYDDTGNELIVEKGSKNRVRVLLPKSTEIKTIDVKYYVGMLYYLCDFVSILTMAGLAIYIYVYRRQACFK